MAKALIGFKASRHLSEQEQETIDYLSSLQDDDFFSWLEAAFNQINQTGTDFLIKKYGGSMPHESETIYLIDEITEHIFTTSNDPQLKLLLITKSHDHKNLPRYFDKQNHFEKYLLLSNPAFYRYAYSSTLKYILESTDGAYHDLLFTTDTDVHAECCKALRALDASFWDNLDTTDFIKETILAHVCASFGYLGKHYLLPYFFKILPTLTIPESPLGEAVGHWMMGHPRFGGSQFEVPADWFDLVKLAYTRGAISELTATRITYTIYRIKPLVASEKATFANLMPAPLPDNEGNWGEKWDNVEPYPYAFEADILLPCMHRWLHVTDRSPGPLGIPEQLIKDWYLAKSFSYTQKQRHQKQFELLEKHGLHLKAIDQKFKTLHVEEYLHVLYLRWWGGKFGIFEMLLEFRKLVAAGGGWYREEEPITLYETLKELDSMPQGRSITFNEIELEYRRLHENRPSQSTPPLPRYLAKQMAPEFYIENEMRTLELRNFPNGFDLSYPSNNIWEVINENEEIEQSRHKKEETLGTKVIAFIQNLIK